MAKPLSLTVRTFRVIAEGDDALGSGFTLGEALVALEQARAQSKRHVAIVDDATGSLVDEGDARRWLAKA